MSEQEFITANLVRIESTKTRYKIKGSNYTYSKKQAIETLKKVYLRELHAKTITPC